MEISGGRWVAGLLKGRDVLELVELKRVRTPGRPGSRSPNTRQRQARAPSSSRVPPCPGCRMCSRFRASANTLSPLTVRKPKAVWVEPSFTAEAEYPDVTSAGRVLSRGALGRLGRLRQRTFSTFHGICLERIDLIAVEAFKIRPTVRPQYDLHARVALRAAVHGNLP